MTTKKIAKLVHPTKAQLEWHDFELEMFVGLDPATWQNREYDNHSTPLKDINPAKLDTEQWLNVAESFGAKLVMFVAKHTGGFCWWQTDTSDYGIKETPWRNGRGDVVGDLSASCRKRNIRLGIYLSPQDACFNAGMGGRCPTVAEQNRYNDIYRRQLTELLTRYGKIDEVWFDGGAIINVSDILHQHAPEAMVFQGPQATIRWVGTELGYAPYPAWNTLYAEDARTGTSTAVHGTPAGDVWMPLEVDTTIRNHYWFWHPDTEFKLKSLDELMEIYYRSVGHGAVLLLNSQPDTSGLIPEPDARRTAEFGAEISRRFGQSLAETKRKGETEIAFETPLRIDHVITMEDIAKGERVREYAIEGLLDNEWVELAQGTSVGHKKIDFFDPRTVTGLRFTTLKSAGKPMLRKLAAYFAGITPKINRHSACHFYNPLRAGAWGEEVGATWTTIEADITSLCNEARQYEVELKPAPDAAPFEAKAVHLIENGMEIDGFIGPTANPRRWNLNITEFGNQKTLRVIMRRAGNGKCCGEIIIRKIILE
ncbi:MAG: alpha-L-fucosidase [Verrucomicrobia bacterium]|nr:alpha-L-fucosidase [Verrucomicrobiota bacterium]MCG2681419.1 alpha-L-fucosidase [Kiritimatiellia bacterium]MBU4248319.1 alpha-L-fucosidase [Verrucomicrobiota bacterium]MBU4289846.1 alpha-L-fucosidase [Verrucomicrobiota bacterium]MBU4430317.1 alpha-L-fucosidase [Verrucomicrobiota bacterium]